jgi:O-antigen ligase
MYREVQWAIREAHSSYIDLALSAGLVAGLALLAAIVLTMRRRAAWYLATRRPEHGFFLGLQLFCLINGLTESAMVMPIFVPFIACCGLAQAARGWIETEPSASTGVGPSTRSAAAPVA